MKYWNVGCKSTTTTTTTTTRAAGISQLQRFRVTFPGVFRKCGNLSKYKPR